MSFDGAIVIGHSYWVLIKGIQKDSEHLSVVLRVEADYVELVYGQTRGSPDGDDEKISYDASTKRLGIAADTHFWRRNVVHVSRGDFRRRAGKCPNRQFLKLEELAERAHRDGLVKDQRPVVRAELRTPTDEPNRDE